ncbi:MAG: sugar transferase [bacterium]
MSNIFRSNIVILIFDLLIALFAFWISRYFGDLPRWYWLLVSAVVWVAVGLITRKLYFSEYKRIRTVLIGLLVVDTLCGFLMFTAYRLWVPSYEYDYSILLASSLIFVLECVLYYFIRLFVYRKIPYFYEEPPLVESDHKDLTSEQEIKNNDLLNLLDKFNDNSIESYISEKTLSEDTIVTNTSNPEVILQNKVKQPTLVLHNKSLNGVRHINTLLSYTNYTLAEDGYIVCNCVTSDVRHNRIFKQSPRFTAKIIYSCDYFIHRVFSKLSVTKWLYYWVTKGERRVLTRVETLGRFYRAGFDVVQEHMVNDKFYIVARKIKEPIRDDKPSNGVLIKLRRKAKNGKIIGVYKFRTMHAYSEYLQPYMLKTGGLCEGGKFANDYRVNTIGKILRKMWLDELPMLINWLKGDLKIVGVRPLSSHYFSLYSKELQELRVKVKPGLLPPFYADMPTTLEEIQESEIRYIQSYLKSPILTDWRYFWKCVNNIVFKGKRSK